MTTDLECVTGCRRLLRREGILAGASSGAVIEGINKFFDSVCDGATCVAILPDRGERYLDTVYSDEWVAAHLGEKPEFLTLIKSNAKDVAIAGVA